MRPAIGVFIDESFFFSSSTGVTAVVVGCEMCLWKLLFFGWKQQPAAAESVPGNGKEQHRRTATSSDDDLSDSGISSGEFSLENVCDDSNGAAIQPPPPPPPKDDCRDR